MPRLVNATLAALALAAFARADTIHVCGGESIQAAINNASAGDEVFVHPGTSVDCNANAVPDECDVAALDCHTNGVPDDCDIAAGTSEDCNNNGVSDECDIAILDSNANGIPDDCDIADCDGSLWCLDCIAAGGVYQGRRHGLRRRSVPDLQRERR